MIRRLRWFSAVGGVISVALLSACAPAIQATPLPPTDAPPTAAPATDTPPTEESNLPLGEFIADDVSDIAGVWKEPYVIAEAGSIQFNFDGTGYEADIIEQVGDYFQVVSEPNPITPRIGRDVEFDAWFE